jgi:hypothetical protein
MVEMAKGRVVWLFNVWLFGCSLVQHCRCLLWPMQPTIRPAFAGRQAPLAVLFIDGGGIRGRC